MNALGPHPALARRPADQYELCNLVGDWSGRIPIGGAIVEPKIDGIRALYIDGELCTREGSTIYGVDHILERLCQIEHEECEPMFFDGEFQVGGSFAETIAHFQAVGARGNAGTFNLFDAIPMRVWRGEGVCETLQARRGKVDRMAEPFLGGGLDLVPWAFMTDASEIEERARELIAAGCEGVVVKHALSTYRRTKGASWQRIRKSLTVDAPIVGWNPLRENEQALGSLVLDVDGVRVNVSAGFSDEERLTMWEARAGLLGAIAEVEAMERTERGSLRQARFVRMRPDKPRRLP
jgi:ATP-dependent DNA ligase